MKSVPASRQAKSRFRRPHLIANVDGQQQAEEAGGGVVTVSVQPGLVDVLEKSGVVNHHLRRVAGRSS